MDMADRKTASVRVGRWLAMSEPLSLPRIDHQISRRSLLRGGVAAAALAALPSC